ncbi:hypothetical protein Bca52824_019525 [Brassica carinata]|uniref:Uncharacterized protein n=1 Tax=Brassica carinata TaxID=52824 RepID=A0A8X8AZS1_BRACI|nr:hypothetical protein Bca52824_019525 [Brassica carinata]
MVDIRQDLVESGRGLLNHAYRAQQEYERTTKRCLDLATEQDNTITEKWLPELKTAILNAQTSLEHCKYVWGWINGTNNLLQLLRTGSRLMDKTLLLGITM